MQQRHLDGPSPLLYWYPAHKIVIRLASPHELFAIFRILKRTPLDVSLPLKPSPFHRQHHYHQPNLDQYLHPLRKSESFHRRVKILNSKSRKLVNGKGLPAAAFSPPLFDGFPLFDTSPLFDNFPPRAPPLSSSFFGLDSFLF